MNPPAKCPSLHTLLLGGPNPSAPALLLCFRAGKTATDPRSESRGEGGGGGERESVGLATLTLVSPDDPAPTLRSFAPQPSLPTQRVRAPPPPSQAPYRHGPDLSYPLKHQTGSRRDSTSPPVGYLFGGLEVGEITSAKKKSSIGNHCPHPVYLKTALSWPCAPGRGHSHEGGIKPQLIQVTRSCLNFDFKITLVKKIPPVWFSFLFLLYHKPNCKWTKWFFFSKVYLLECVCLKDEQPHFSEFDEKKTSVHLECNSLYNFCHDLFEQRPLEET
jgi:hypothetical protein